MKVTFNMNCDYKVAPIFLRLIIWFAEDKNEDEVKF